MKEQNVPGLTPRCVSQVYYPGVTEASGSSVVESTTGETAVPMSNLELLGSVAFAMSRTDGVDDCTGQPVVLSTNAGSLSLAENGEQLPGSHVVYIVPTGDDDAAQSYAAVLQTVEHSAVADGENVGGNDCAQSISDITNTPSVYFTTLPDNYDTLCNVGPFQFNVCNAVSGTNEHNDNIASACMEDELVEPSATCPNVVSTANSGFMHTIDTSLDSFSLSMLTNAVTS